MAMKSTSGTRPLKYLSVEKAIKPVAGLSAVNEEARSVPAEPGASKKMRQNAGLGVTAASPPQARAVLFERAIPMAGFCSGAEGGIALAHPCTRRYAAMLCMSKFAAANLSNPYVNFMGSHPAILTTIKKPAQSRVFLLWRRGWDSNPRTPVKMLLEFQSSAFGRSATSPHP
jgi:hypothetical protein